MVAADGAHRFLPDPRPGPVVITGLSHNGRIFRHREDISRGGQKGQGMVGAAICQGCHNGVHGHGDLYVTAQGGRNCRMGRYLGLGMPYSEAKAKYMPDDTIEGAQLAEAVGPTVEKMIANGDLDENRLPLFQTMIDIVCHDAPVQIPWDRFFAES